MKFIGILLPNGELNFLSYNGNTIQQISNVFANTSNGTYSFPTFMTNKTFIEDNCTKKNK